MISFGDEATDSITGFSGIAIERRESISGIVVWGLQPEMDEYGMIPEMELFEEERLIFSLKELREMKTGKNESEPNESESPDRP